MDTLNKCIVENHVLQYLLGVFQRCAQALKISKSDQNSDHIVQAIQTVHNATINNFFTAIHNEYLYEAQNLSLQVEHMLLEMFSEHNESGSLLGLYLNKVKEEKAELPRCFRKVRLPDFRY